MIHDAKVEVTCDGELCRASIIVDLHYVYMDRFGHGGHYDTSDESINKSAREEGWTVRGREHFCEECAEGQAMTAQPETIEETLRGIAAEGGVATAATLVAAAGTMKSLREALSVTLHDYRCRLKEAGYARELIDEFTGPAVAALKRAEERS